MELFIGYDENRHEKVVEVEKSSEVEKLMEEATPETFGTDAEGLAQIKHDFEQMQDGFFDSDIFNGDPNASLTMATKNDFEKFLTRMMNDMRGLFTGEYLADAWGILRVREAPLKEYTIEELSWMTPSDIIEYRKMFPKEKSEQIHSELMAYLDNRNFLDDCDWVVARCDEVKTKYGADSRCAMAIVQATLLKKVWDELKG